ncbi:hypothetical protein [Aquipseudomonas ullengensis]|uniref:TubC N-terminal docking domain-containing protein n=1 Tax=Aquipseudomonas ullengensis TaxID=2759166 RepID=A0A7W4LI54_9GAMM|nr:hypothetical protein [Pseudomonas ullengensis]MBB2493507.1 hypothetical protein [Pseudomonas ullengensis]
MSTIELLGHVLAEGILLVLEDGHLTWEADHAPSCELLEEIRAHRLEIIEALSETNDPMKWLARLAVLLCCTPDYLLEHSSVDHHDLAEQYQRPPWQAARLIRTDPNWILPSENSACAHERDAPAGQPARTWLPARDAFHHHALGNCPYCYPPLERYCTVGADLHARYDHETSILEASNEEG